MASPLRETFPCPKCNRTLRRSGTVETDGKTVAVFQCDECIVKQKIFGEDFDTALTFAIGESGQPFDPADPDGRLRF